MWQELMQSNSTPPSQSSSYAAQNNFNKIGSKSFYPVALLLLFCLIRASSPLQCFVCDSYIDAHCGDPFYHEDDYEYNNKRPKDPSLLRPCPPDSFCRKIYQNVRGEERVIRSCGSVPDETDRDCYTTVHEEYNTLVCQCDNEDGCNSGNMFQVSSITILSAILLAYLIH